MVPLEFVDHLWDSASPEEDKRVAYDQLIAQTSGGVVNAIDNFAHAFCHPDDHWRIFAAIEERQGDLLGVGVLTFKHEFLSLSKLLECGLIVIQVSQGKAVRSADTWRCDALAPRALDREEARECFARGMVAVVLDKEAGLISAFYVKKQCDKAQLLRVAASCTEKPPAKRAKATEAAEAEPSARVREMRALIRSARAALRRETSAPPPVSSK